MGLAGNVAGLIAGKKERKQSYFLGSAEPAHRLALDKAFPHSIVRLSGLLGERVDTLLKRRRLDGTWTDRVTTDALLDEIGGDGLGQPDHGSLGRAVGVTRRHATDRRHRGRYIDDRAL